MMMTTRAAHNTTRDEWWMVMMMLLWLMIMLLITNTAVSGLRCGACGFCKVRSVIIHHAHVFAIMVGSWDKLTFRTLKHSFANKARKCFPQHIEICVSPESQLRGCSLMWICSSGYPWRCIIEPCCCMPHRNHDHVVPCSFAVMTAIIHIRASVGIHARHCYVICHIVSHILSCCSITWDTALHGVSGKPVQKDVDTFLRLSYVICTY